MIKKLGFYEAVKFFKYIKPRAFSYIIGLLSDTATEASAAVVIPIVIKYMMDAAINRDISILKQGAMIAGIEAILISVVFIGVQHLFWGPTIKIIADIKVIMVRHCLNLPISYFEKNHSGDLISRLSNDINVLYNLYGFTLRQIFVAGFSGIGSAIVMIALDWRFGGILVLLVIISAILNSILSVKVRETSNRLQKVMAELTENVSNMFSGFTIMKMFHIDEILRNKFIAKNDEVQKLTYSRFKLTARLNACNFVISWLNFVGVIAVGAVLSFDGNVGIGTLLAEITLLGNVNMMIKSMGGLISSMQGNLAGAARVMELLNEEPEPDSYLNSNYVNSTKMLEMVDVSFKYDENPALTGINLSLEKGCKVALVGSSGGGKSTIAKLFMGFYPPTCGDIVICGKPLGEYTLEQLRDLIAYVPQDAYIFDGTIEENIRLGKQNATKEEVEEASKLAFAHDFIMEMPDGYSTNVGERGTRLSGGQRQRIAIARSILKDAQILLLDEATSALDSHSEEKVQVAIERLMKGRTVLIIAHRLSTVENADLIYVIEDGKVTEQGKHRQLIGQGGTYSKLYSMQFK